MTNLEREALTILLKRVRYERARFAKPDSDGSYGMPSQEYTDEVVAATRPYVETWIAPIIDKLLELGEKDTTAYRRAVLRAELRGML